MGAWTLCYFHSLINDQPFRGALTASAGSCAEIKSGVTSSGRVLEEGAGERCSECGYLPCLSPFLIGRTFVREPGWEYSANLVDS